MTNKSIYNALKRMWEHSVASFASKGEVNAGVGGGGGSTQKITFTDRPSLYSWLQENWTKAYRVVATMNGASIILNDIRKTEDFYTFCSYQVGSSNTETEVYFTRGDITADGCELSLNTQIGNSYAPDQVPDEYWQLLGITFEIYYIAEGGGSSTVTKAPTLTREGHVVTIHIDQQTLEDSFYNVALGIKVGNRFDDESHDTILAYIDSLTYEVDLDRVIGIDEYSKGRYYLEAYAIAYGYTKSKPAIISYDYENKGSIPSNHLYSLNREYLDSPLDMSKVVDLDDWNTALANVPICFGAPLSGNNPLTDAIHIGFNVSGDSWYILNVDNDSVLCEVVDGVPNWKDYNSAEWFVCKTEQDVAVPISLYMWLTGNSATTTPYYDASNRACEFKSPITIDDWQESSSFIRANFVDTNGNYHNGIIYEKVNGVDRIRFDTEIVYDAETLPNPSINRIKFLNDTYIPDSDEYRWFWHNFVFLGREVSCWVENTDPDNTYDIIFMPYDSHLTIYGDTAIVLPYEAVNITPVEETVVSINTALPCKLINSYNYDIDYSKNVTFDTIEGITNITIPSGVTDVAIIIGEYSTQQAYRSYLRRRTTT